MQPTLVSFPDGSLTGEAEVLVVDPASSVVVVDATPFHPVDHTWPDQPGDAGTLRVGDAVFEITEAVMAAISDEGALAVGSEIPVKRGAEGWTWLVGRRLAPVPTDGADVAGGADVADGAVTLGALEVGAVAVLEVVAFRRVGLSRGHTACHLASLALDLAVADLWRKDPGTDALGNPDFEGRANQSSRIHEDGSVDEYRLGKSLRKAGFDTESFAASLGEREAQINAQLTAWVASGAASRVVVDGPSIVDRRRWECELPEGTASIPCGGTHASSLAEFGSISVSLDLSDPQLLVMTTTAVPAA